jgi:hypothetical protein
MDIGKADLRHGIPETLKLSDIWEHATASLQSRAAL